jgi:fatty acid desaturase
LALTAATATPSEPAASLRPLMRRRDLPGAAMTAVTFGTLLATGTGVVLAIDTPWLLLALPLHALAMVPLFAALHECAHRTAFADRDAADVVAWIAALPILWNAGHYRRFHRDHHRFTHDPERDPELARGDPRDLGDYLFRLSGLAHWRQRMSEMALIVWGRWRTMPWVATGDRPALRRSVAGQLAVYLLVVATAAATGTLIELALIWPLPLALALPVMRLWLLAEHTGCPHTADGFRNTRTTLTWAPVRFALWNMPFHAEHHLHPAIPFHALPQAHAILRPRLTQVATGYLATHRALIRSLAWSAPARPRGG